MSSIKSACIKRWNKEYTLKGRKPLSQSSLPATLAALFDDDAVKFTSEVHDPCACSRCLQERTIQKHLQGAPVWSRPNTLRRLSQKCFYNSRVLERS